MQLQHWLTLTIEHEYFKEGICPIFDLIPTASTRNVLKNYDIHIRKLANQYQAYVGLTASKAVWEVLPTSDLFFQLIHTDPYFNSYTEVPLDTSKDHLVFLTNANQTQGPEGNTVLSATYLPVQSLRFQVETATDLKNQVVVKNSEGTEVFNQLTAEKQSRLSINIEAFGSGLYELWIDKKLAKTFFGTSESLEEACYGILQLQMHPIITALAAQRIPELTARFSARQTYWQYAVVVPEYKKIVVHDMQVEGAENTLYSGPEEKKIGTASAKVFTSPNAIKLSQNIRGSPLLKMKYSNEFSAAVLELDLKMPLPKASAVFPQKTANAFYAQTIFYI